MPTFFTDSASFNNVQVTGSTLLSGSGVVLRVIGSGSTIFSISGSSGEIFSISDSGSSTNLFSVSSGSTTILQIDSSKNVSISGSLIVTGSITGSLLGSSSYALTASYALNGGGGGVTQIVAGTNISISPAGGTGVVTINSTGGTGDTTAIEAQAWFLI